GFLAGPDGNAAMVEKLAARTGATVVSTAGAMVDVLRHAFVTSAPVVTPYLPPVNDGLRAYLAASGIAVQALESFLGAPPAELGRLTERQVHDLVLRTVTPRSEALFIACSQLPTLGILDNLRHRLKIPVWSSIAATAWAGARAATTKQTTAAVACRRDDANRPRSRRRAYACLRGACARVRRPFPRVPPAACLRLRKAPALQGAAGATRRVL